MKDEMALTRMRSGREKYKCFVGLVGLVGLVVLP
jgi:hypothetical protein